jgi:tetratricopeptide (TPR) repeat protein
MNRYPLRVLGAFAIAILCSVLYLPFLSNALVFDDHNLFTNLVVYDYAQTPFDFRPRTFPYFTLGIIQVLIGSIEAQRITSLILHFFCALMLFVLLAALLKQALQQSETNFGSDVNAITTKASVLAFAGAAWFAIHPVAVYGAGYLAQRTILFATLFSLLSLWFYRRAFVERRTADTITAALFYSAAIFSKEHAVMLPLVAVALTSLYGGEFRTNVKRACLYLLLCLPAALTAILAAKGVVATSYEPYVGEVATQIHGISLLEKSWGPWFVSTILQASAFFDYFYYWVIPDVRSISADMRIDFAQNWTSGWLFAKAALFVACPFAALFCLLRGGRTALFGCGLLYSWLLYLTELSTVRFQEPFVLYRSYLWAPGFAIMLLGLLSRMRWQRTLVVCAITTPVFFILSHDRLQSFVSERTIWEDAAAKLSSPNVPGADRIYYNRGGERFKLGQMESAMDDLNRVVTLNPLAFQGYLGRGLIYLKTGDNPRALSELDKSLAINPKFGFAHYRRGVALERLGRLDEALVAYAAAEKTGDFLAKMRRRSLTNAAH